MLLEVASGRFRDASALVELLLTRAMWLRDRDGVSGFSEEEKKSIDQMLHEAMNSFDRGDYSVVRPGEFKDLALRLVGQHNQKHAS